MRTARRPTLVLGTVLAAVLALTACGSDGTADDPGVAAPPTSSAPATSAPGTGTRPTAPPTTSAPAGPVITVSYAGGKVSGDTGRTKAKVGEQITLRVTSDSKQQVHIHGADLLVDVAAGQTAEQVFSEKAPGVYEIELHPSDFVLARVEIS